MFSREEEVLLSAVNELEILLRDSSVCGAALGQNTGNVLLPLVNAMQYPYPRVQKAVLSVLHIVYREIHDIIWNFIPQQYLPAIRADFVTESPVAAAAAANSFQSSSSLLPPLSAPPLLELANRLHAHINSSDFISATSDLQSIQSLLESSAPPPGPLDAEGLFVALSETLTLALRGSSRGLPIAEPVTCAVCAFCRRLKGCCFNVSFLSQDCIDVFVNALVRGYAARSERLSRAFVDAFKTLPLGSLVVSLLRVTSLTLSRSPPDPDDANVPQACANAIAESIRTFARSTQPLHQLTEALVPEIRTALVYWHLRQGIPAEVGEKIIGLLNFLYTKCRETVVAVSQRIEATAHRQILAVYLAEFQREEQQQQQQQQQGSFNLGGG